jgi:organic radical activating enzyme
MTQDRDYYCNNKFKFLKVDLEKRNTYVCHASRGHKIDVEWLRQNPGELFNTEINMLERQQMLANQRNSSCEQNCWFAEDKGGHGPRILEKGYERTHFQIRTRPEIIDITLGSDCNLKCTYCCKEYSSAWRNDILQFGSYINTGEPDRYTAVPIDLVLKKNSQKQKSHAGYYQTVLSELYLLSEHAKHIIITGGEPLLFNSLPEMLANLSACNDIKVFTGLGVDYKRFERMVAEISKIPQVRLCVSIENLGPYYEFNRYGMQWTDAEKKIRFLEATGIKMSLHSTLSNLTMFGFPEFYDRFKDLYSIGMDFVYNPKFMPIYVMDPHSKVDLVRFIEASDLSIKTELLTTLAIEPEEEQRLQISDFLRQFLARNLNANAQILPKSFLDWLC